MPEIAGRFREPGESVTFGGGGKHQREGEPGERIKEALTGLFSETRPEVFAALAPEQVSIACAKFLVRFLRVHPFVDGNGRVGRSLIALLCRLGGRFELRWASGDGALRRRYIRALEYAHQRAPDVAHDGPFPRGYAPVLLARWIEPQLHCAPLSLEEAEPPEPRLGFDDA